MDLLGQSGEGLRTKATSSVRGSGGWAGAVAERLGGPEQHPGCRARQVTERLILPVPESAPGEQMDSGVTCDK